MVGSNLGKSSVNVRIGSWNRQHLRGDSCFHNPFCNLPHSVSVLLVIPFVNREIEAISSIKLYVKETRAESVDNLPSDIVQRVRMAIIYLRMLPPRSTILSGRSRRI